MEQIKKAYYLLFYKVYRFWEAISYDSWSDWKAYVIISCTEMLFLVELIVWWSVATKMSFDVSKVWLTVIGLIISIINYNLFLSNDRWKEYEAEFKNYSKQKSRIAGWLSFMFLVGVLSSLIFAFYQMSLIDWSKYRY